jgi:hypothetical protein
MYIVTDMGISFYNDTDSLPQVENQIFKTVNNITINNPKRIKFKGTKVYIVADNYISTANVKTFENKGDINGFSNPVDLDYVSHDRLFVVDKGDSKVKVVDMTSLDITAQIETGDNTQPVFIISKWWRSIVMNGGLVADSLKDSTIVSIDYKDNLVPLANFNGSIYVGENPNSAVWINDLKILCKGIYDPNNSLNNTEASLVRVNPWNMEVVWTQNLSNIYNARNLTATSNDNVYFFTADDGVYQMNNDGSGVSQKINFTSDFIDVKVESYDLTDTTSAYANMLYVNDANTIYKYNTATSAFCDTIVVYGNVRDVNFY